jgi:hypothetical protein
LYAGFVNDDDEEDITVPPTATTTATATSPVGDNYVITCADGEDTNYTFDCTATGKLTITPAKLTVTALPATSIYGNDLPTYEFEYSGFVNNEDEETPGVITTMPTLTCEVAEGSDAGDYVDAIVPSDAAAGNYTFKYVNGKLTIEQRVLTVTPDDKERVYGEANPETFKLFYEGFAEGEDESVINKLPTAETDAVATSPVGDHYKITCTGGEDTNYTFDCTNIGKLTVTKAPLTVTAKDATRAYGEANPVFTVAYAGWKNGENEGSLSVEPAVACGADEASPAGSYPITFLVGEAANYVFTYVPGTLTVLEVYAVRIPASEGGRVTAEPSSAAAGKVVTLRIAPENGYALTSIGVRWTAAPNTALALSGEGEVRTFVMPAAGVTVSAAFRKTEDRLALEEAVRRLEKASFVVDQEVLNTQEEAFTWLLDTLNVLLEDLNISVPTRNLWIYNFSRAIAGAPSLPAGRDGGFAATVSLSRNGNYGMEYVYGTILATRYVPVGVEAPQVEALTTYVRGGMLYVNGLAVGEAWSVYDISGKRVYQGAAATVPLAVRGVYIVRTETRSVRVVY